MVCFCFFFRGERLLIVCFLNRFPLTSAHNALTDLLIFRYKSGYGIANQIIHNHLQLKSTGQVKRTENFKNGENLYEIQYLRMLSVFIFWQCVLIFLIIFRFAESFYSCIRSYRCRQRWCFAFARRPSTRLQLPTATTIIPRWIFERTFARASKAGPTTILATCSCKYLHHDLIVKIFLNFTFSRNYIFNQIKLIFHNCPS